MSERDEVMEYRLSKVEEAVESIAESLKQLAEQGAHAKEMAEAINRAFVEIRRNREDYEKSCKDVDDRLRIIEVQLPVLMLTSRWVISGTIAVVGAVFIACGAIIWALGPSLLKSIGG